MTRTHIAPGTRLAIGLSVRERDRMVEKAFLDPEIERALRKGAPAGSKVVINLTLDDIDDLHGCVAAEANHSGDATTQRLLDAVCDRLGKLFDEFTDEPPAHGVPALRPRSQFTAKQGQYLAFIHSYTKVHRMAPSEADLQKYFQVTPPTVHGMILTLERLGLIERTPGKARSIQVCVSSVDLPALL